MPQDEYYGDSRDKATPEDLTQLVNQLYFKNFITADEREVLLALIEVGYEL